MSVKYVANKAQHAPSEQSRFRDRIICALPLEADAVEVLFDETYDRLGKFYGKQPGDANAYINGRLGDHDVVLCYMLRMGKGSAASVASSLRVSYTGVQFALVVGICGGVPYPSTSTSKDTEIFLGDVIISDSVVEYDFGRQYPSGFHRKTDGNKDMLGGPDREIRTLLTGLKASRARDEFQDQMVQQLHNIQQLYARWRHPDALKDILFEAGYHHSIMFKIRLLCAAVLMVTRQMTYARRHWRTVAILLNAKGATFVVVEKV
jgi:hypothetical protein